MNSIFRTIDLLCLLIAPSLVKRLRVWKNIFDIYYYQKGTINTAFQCMEQALKTLHLGGI
jgi:hypothetical protein